MVEKEIIDISIKLFWNVNDSSATFVGPLEFTTVLNHGFTTIKDLDEPDTILLNGNSYKKIADSDIHDFISPINNVSLEEVHEEGLMHDDLQEPLDVFPDQSNEQDNQENEEELILDDSISSQEPQNNQKNENELILDHSVLLQESVGFPDQSGEQIDSQDNQRTYDGMANAPSNQYPIVLIPSVNVELLNLKLQRSPSQIDDSEDEIDDNSESSKVNEQSSEIQEDDDHQEQSDDSLPPEKNSKSLRVNKRKSKKRKRKVSLNISRKKKEKTQIQHAFSSETDSDEDESMSSDAAIEELQISSTTNEIEKNKAHLLKDNFEIVQRNQFIVYGDKLFSKNRSIEDLLIPNFNHLFNDINVINFSLQPLPSYSTNMESLDNYFKEWKVQYNQLKYTKTEVEEKMLKLLYELRGAYLTLLIILSKEYERDKKKLPGHKILRGLVKGKVKSILRIGERHEQRYWVGTWRLIELLNITHCPASILVESGLTARYLMRDANYNQFLKSLLNNVEVNHEAPRFSKSLMLRIKEKEPKFY
ncbi:9649_t:CDS:10 [Dentiscutata erythropus]|uniref:9649_t:CDS:1 n=1 Tax=Dentiscutata erythropus TaxID=1348616 RepID=A0A9N9CS35_9GLOM|nr:9649_t:CDS:10 [Dentiscutata erythropus]